MSDYGLRIRNYEAGSLFAYNNGARDRYDFTDAMFTNSLFSEFIIENGLTTFGKKNDATRDIICIEFNYGSRSYEEEIEHLDKLIKTTKENVDGKYTEDQINSRVDKFNELKGFADANKDKFIKMSAEQIRDIFYRDGLTISYPTYKKNGELNKKVDKVKYKMLYRTPGKAKKGSCMFINKKLFDVADDFLRMGIKLPKKNSPIIEMGAYKSLITSTIVGKVKINPKNILCIKDVDSFFERDVVSVETDEDKHCIVKRFDKYTLKNTLFDGQALIDSSIFPEWGNGYILLRHHLTKMAAFCTNIQLFFKDYYGDEYLTATVKDMFGNDHYVKDIELITTDNAFKWLKFGISYDYWCDKVYDNGCMFGIVKTAHESKLGEVQRMSYQMGNSLEMDIMPQVTQCTVDYIKKLKADNDVFLDYLRDNKNFFNDYDVLVALVEQDRSFLRSEYFRDRKRKIIETYIMNFKNGKIIQNADNLVIVGSPYAMLLASVGEDAENDDTFLVEDDAIQCYTERFDNGEYLAEFRSPFNSKNNMGYLHNHHDDRIKRYFKFGKQIIAINMIHTDFQDRNNGSDQDSDSIYTTNQKDIVACAKMCYKEYPTIVNNIPMEKNSYDNTLENHSLIDNNLSAAQLAIGESSNLAQICLTYTYNFEDQKYSDYVCVLSVLAQVAIDNAKRKFDIDLNEEISRIKKDMNISENGYPSFWSVIRKGFNKSKINSDLKCPMNYIFDMKYEKYRSSESTLPMSEFFVKYELNVDRRKSKAVEELIQKYSLDLYSTRREKSFESMEHDDCLLLRVDFENLINDIKKIYISKNYVGLMSWLIDRAFLISPNSRMGSPHSNNKMSKNKSILLKTLYDINSEQFLKCFAKNVKK